jgi:hypothetical protein
MEPLESRIAALESRIARWRISSVVLPIAAGVAAWAAARTFPPKAPAPTELRVADGSRTATLTASGLTLEGSSNSLGQNEMRATLSLDQGLTIDGVRVSREGLTIRSSEVTATMSADQLIIRKGDTELVGLASGMLSLRQAGGEAAPSAILAVDANTARLELIRPETGTVRLSQSRMPLLCSGPPSHTDDELSACAHLGDLARVAQPKR